MYSQQNPTTTQLERNPFLVRLPSQTSFRNWENENIRESTKESSKRLHKYGVSAEEITVLDIMKSIPYSKFHKLLISIHLMLYISTSFIVYNMVYFQLQPAYMCTDSVNKQFEYKCQKEEVCQISSQIFSDPEGVNQLPTKSFRIDDTDHHTLQNWITWLGLSCANNYEIGLFGSLYFCGFLISSLIFPPLSDKYGRRNLFLFGAIAQLITISLMIALKTQLAQMSLIFLLGFAQPVKSMIAYTHLIEFVPGRECLISGMFMFIDGLVVVITPVIFIFVSQDLNTLLIIALGLNLTSLIMFGVIRVPESLKFLLINDRYEDFEKGLQLIEKISKKQETTQFDHTITLLKKYQEQQSRINLLDDSFFQIQETDECKLSQSKQRIRVAFNLLMMIIAWSCVSFSFFLLSFFIKYLPGDIYHNQAISGLASAAFILAGPMSKKFDNRQTLSIAFFVAFVSSMIMMALVMFYPNKIVYLALLILLTRAGINLAFCFVFIIHTEIFPTLFLASSYGICNFFCRLVTLSAPIVAESENKAIPLICLMVAGLIGTLCSMSLKKVNTNEDTLIKRNYSKKIDDDLLNTSFLK